jgi:hypothetical protein
VATEDISRVHQAFERFQKYHWLRFLADTCISSPLAKIIYVVCCCGYYGNGKNLFHEAEEDISWDHPVFKRLRKYHWLGFHADICISSHWQKPSVQFVVAGIRVSAKVISCGYRGHIMGPPCIRKFSNISLVRVSR